MTRRYEPHGYLLRTQAVLVWPRCPSTPHIRLLEGKVEMRLKETEFGKPNRQHAQSPVFASSVFIDE